jgi:hypothetical protein
MNGGVIYFLFIIIFIFLYKSIFNEQSSEKWAFLIEFTPRGKFEALICKKNA